MTMSLLSRLSEAESAFFSAVSKGFGPSMTDFQDSWYTLFQELAAASEAGSLDEQTENLWTDVATKITLHTEHLLSVAESTQSILASHESELETVLSNFAVDGLETPSQKEDIPKDSTPSYVAPALSWLLDNLHNPYPPKQLLNQLAQQSGSTRQSIKNWFNETRKRIGWTNLRKARFNNRQADIVNAATRFFVEGGSQSVDEEIRNEFVSIQISLGNMYNSKFAQSNVALELDEDLARENQCGAQTAGENARTRSHQVECDAIAPPSQGHALDKQTQVPSQKKRRRVSSDTEDEPYSGKRSRLESSPAVNSNEVRSSISHIDTRSSSPGSTPTPTSSRCTSPESAGPLTPPSRKRRNLDSDEDGVTNKRARHDDSGITVHVEPPSESTDLDNWFNLGTNPALVTPPDEPLCNVEVFDYSKWTSLTSFENPTDCRVFSDTSGLAQPPLLNELHNDALVTTTQPYDIENLFDEFEATYRPLPPEKEVDVRASHTEFAAMIKSLPQNDYAVNGAFGWQEAWCPPSYLPQADNWPSTMNDPPSPVTALDTYPQSALFKPNEVNSIATQPSTELVLPLTKAEKKKRLAQIQEEARRLQEEIAQS